MLPSRFIALLITCLLAGSLAAIPSHAASESEALKQKQAEIADIRKRLNAAKGKAAAIEEEVGRLDAQIADLDQQIQTGEHDISSLESDIRSLEAQIEQTRQEFQVAADTANARARRLYVQGPADALALLFAADSISELTRLQFLLEKSSEKDAQTIVSASRLKGDLEQQQNELNQIVGSLTKQREWLQARKDLVASARSDRASALGSVQSEINDIQSHIDGLEADSRRLEAAIRQSSGSSDPGGEVSSSGFVRPVPGRVTSGFGRRWGRAHTGVDLDGRTGDPIRAANSGRILGVSCGRGYGICTIIDHGGGTTTLYAHMTRKAVGSGSVSKGQVIGYVGCTGSCTGSHLHYEVRRNGTPINPARGYI